MKFTKTQQFHIRLLLFIIPFLMGCGIDLYTPSLLTISDYFNVPDNLVQMTIGVYMLGYGIGQAILGISSDLFGRKKIIVSSAILYTVISFLTAVYSPTIFYLIAYRFMQGIAIAGMAAVSRAIAVDCYSGVALSKALTLISTSFGLGPIIAPLIGAYLQHYFNWQADFYFFGIFGLFVSLLAFFKLPETIANCHELHAGKILTNTFRISLNKIFLAHTLLGSLAYAFLVIFNVVAPFLVQSELHYSVIDYGKIILVLGFAYFSGTISNRFLLSHSSPMQNTGYGLIGMLLFSVILLILSWSLPMNINTLIIPTWVIFFLSGLVFPNSMTKSLSLFPRSAGAASALFGTWLGVVIFVMTALVGIFKINSQASLAIMFIAMLVISLLFFILSFFWAEKQKRTKPLLILV